MNKNPKTEIERLDLRSHDNASNKTAELLKLFPEIRTEGGKIDIDRLRRVLGETVDPGKERYGMNWPGKADCFKTIQQPSLATLRPYLAMGFCELSRIVDVEAIVRLAEPKAQPAVLNEASKKKSWPLRLVWKLDRFSSE